MRKAIAIDFDGCLCSDAYPNIGEPNWNVIEKAKTEQRAGAGLILWTCREGQFLQDAVNACKSWGLTFDAVNESLPDWIEAYANKPRKVGATEYWDDRAAQISPDGRLLLGESNQDALSNDPLTLEELLEMDGNPVWVDDVILRRDRSCGGLWAIVSVAYNEVTFDGRNSMPLKDVIGFAYRRKLEEDIPVSTNRLKELAEADAHGMVLVSEIPIGTMVYQLNQGNSEEVRIIDGEEYTRKVPNWYITHHEYSWVDAIVDAEHPERTNNPRCRYYFTLEEARAERDRINAGGDPYL